jgi:hypothetical protein
MKMWQLRIISTNEPLSSPQPLPENWGPIFGLHGFIERIGDLSWLGPEYKDRGWFEVGDAETELQEATKADIVWEKAKQLLKDSDWTMLSDVPMSSGQKTAWIDYRRSLREIRLQAGFPDNIVWPAAPE